MSWKQRTTEVSLLTLLKSLGFNILISKYQEFLDSRVIIEF